MVHEQEIVHRNCIRSYNHRSVLSAGACPARLAAAALPGAAPVLRASGAAAVVGECIWHPASALLRPGAAATVAAVEPWLNLQAGDLTGSCRGVDLAAP